jgi:CSLREA domain-containing protein
VNRRGSIQVVAAAVAALLIVPAGASAQTAPPPVVLNVNLTADGNDGECAQDCTLREAINIGRPQDTIRVPPGRYLINDVALNPTGDQIVGSGAGVTVIDGQDLRWQVFSVGGGATSITGVTVTGGVGISASPDGFGGGIHVAAGATLDLTDSVVVNNRAQSGGGIASQGTLRVARTTVSGNRAEGLQVGSVGGVYVIQGSTEIRNTTVSGNSANTVAGGIGTNGQLVLENVTVAYNTAPTVGGVAQAVGRVAPDTTLDNTIVARNTGGACGGDTGGVSVWKGDHNLDDDGSCEFNALGDLPAADPQIGLLAANGGPTQTHALAATSPAINAGADCASTDQRGAARSGACDIGAFEYLPPAPQPSQPSPGGLPAPVLHETVNAIPARGTIKVKRPGAKRFRKLAVNGAQLPVGTTVDALKGRVTIVAASDDGGGTDTAVFYGGIFKIGQTKGKKPTTILSLTEKLSCPKAGSASIAATKKKKRRLWGDGEGKFRTKGKHSAATVVGTKWLVEDRCKSTLTRVVRGRVSVRDFAKKKTVIVRRGKRYIARAG